MCQNLGIEVDDAAIPRIASGFAGGIGNTGAICGALVGGVMAIGLARGRADSMRASLEGLRLPARLRRRFEAAMGTISCRQLTGCDLTTDEGLRRYMESDTPEKVCFPAVATAYRLTLEVLEQRDR